MGSVVVQASGLPVTADLKVRTTSVAADLKVRTTSVAADLKVRTTSVTADLKVRTTNRDLFRDPYFRRPSPTIIGSFLIHRDFNPD
jgi:hypothetical protein